MIFGKSSLEFKVGIFVFLALLVLLVFVLMIGDFKNMISTYKVDFVFNFVNGIKEGAPVRFAGVDIGEVNNIKLVYNKDAGKSKVHVVGWIRKDAKIPVDSQVWVNTLGLLGEKYIDIMPGQDNINFIKDKDAMVGNDPFAMHEFGELAKSIALKVDESILEIKDLAFSVKTLTNNMDKGLVRILNQEGTVGKLLYDDQLYNELTAFVADIKKHPWKLFWKGKDDPRSKETGD